MNPQLRNPQLHNPREYWHGLAALRGTAMLLGIALHASIPYMSTPLSGMNNWACYETPTVFCDILFWWVHVWRIPLFFFLAGFFALQTLQRHGSNGFARRRLKRLCIPYLAAVYLVGPPIYILFSLGWYTTGQCSWEQIWHQVPLPEHLAVNSFGPSHLWFLQELIIFNLVFLFLYVALGTAEKKTSPSQAVNKKSLPWWLPVCPGILSGLMLWSDLTPLTEWHNTFLGVPPRLLYNSVFFIGGIVAYQHRSAFFQVTNFYRRHLLLALPLSAAFLWIRLSSHIDHTTAIGSFALSISAGLLCWLMVYGMIGAFTTGLAIHNPVVEYLSDASYWTYIIHLPIVVAIQIAAFDMNMNSLWKFSLVSAVTATACLVSYQRLVRYSIIGEFLHGPRTRPLHTTEVPSFDESQQQATSKPSAHPRPH